PAPPPRPPPSLHPALPILQALTQSDPSLHAAFLDDKRRAEGESHFARNSGRYPLTGRGDVNPYPLFAELGKTIMGGRGRMGMVLDRKSTRLNSSHVKISYA